MTKKTSLLLTGLFAVSGILPCHAEYEFISELPSWSARDTMFDRLGVRGVNNKSGPFSGSDWSEKTKQLFKWYQEETKNFQDAVNDLTLEATRITSADLKSPEYKMENNGTALFEVADHARKLEKLALSGQSVEDINNDTAILETIKNDLTDRIQLATEQGIDISDLTGSNNKNQPSKQSAAFAGTGSA